MVLRISLEQRPSPGPEPEPMGLMREHCTTKMPQATRRPLSMIFGWVEWIRMTRNRPKFVNQVSQTR